MTTYIAASLAVPDTDQCLATLHKLVPMIDMAEICLDAMISFDLPRLIQQSPCPLIITCRPRWEGGHFAGSETERVAILLEAMELGCAYIDVEWSVRHAFAQRCGSLTRLIVSRHWFDHMPANLGHFYEELRADADVVKLVGMANRSTDVLPILAFLHSASSPIIGIAMGDKGQITRLLAPCFSHCLLTYIAADSASLTAPGQLTVSELVHQYHLSSVNTNTPVHIHLCASAETAHAISQHNAHLLPDQVLRVPLVVSREEVGVLSLALREFVPRLTLTVDPLLTKKT
jgi:3-dehydroquinate dehydratase / shikimate dehydrogenase